MDKQRILFENLKSIKDYWVNTGVEGLSPKADLIWSECEDQYKLLQSKFQSPEDIRVYGEVLNEIITGVMNSVLVMIDGGDVLADYYLVDLVDQDTRESLKANVSLNEEFFSYLLNVDKSEQI